MADTATAPSRPSAVGEVLENPRIFAAFVLAAAGPVSRTAAVHQGFGMRPAAVTTIFVLAWVVTVRRARDSSSSSSSPASLGPLATISVGVGVLTALAGGHVVGLWSAVALLTCSAATVGVRGVVRPLALRWSPVPVGLVLLSAGFSMDADPRWREAGFASFVAAVISLVVLVLLAEFAEELADRWCPVERGWSRVALGALHAGAVLLVVHAGFFAVGLGRGAAFGYAAWQKGFGGKGAFLAAVAVAGPVVVPAAILAVGAAVTLMGRRVLGRVSLGVLGVVVLSAVSTLLGLWLVPDGLA